MPAGPERISRSYNSELILPRECLGLPPICQRGAKQVLVRIQEMESEKKWFRTRTPEELEEILSEAQGRAQNMFDVLRPFKKPDMSWKSAKSTWAFATKEALKDADLDEKRVSARFAVRAAARKVSESAARKAAIANLSKESALAIARNSSNIAILCASGETVKDQAGLEVNPFSVHLSLLELGAAKIGFDNSQSSTKNEATDEPLIVYFPVKLDGNRKQLVKLTFSDKNGVDVGR